MSAYEVAHDFAGPVATVIASLTAALVTGFFAFRQWKITKDQAEVAVDKVKIEIMKERMTAITATRTMIREVTNQPPGRRPNLTTMRQLQRTIDDGRYLFSADANDKIKKITNACFIATNRVKVDNGRGLTATELEANENIDKAKDFITNALNQLPKSLEAEVSPTYLIGNSRTAARSAGPFELVPTGIATIAWIGILSLGVLIILFFALAVLAVRA